MVKTTVSPLEIVMQTHYQMLQEAIMKFSSEGNITPLKGYYLMLKALAKYSNSYDPSKPIEDQYLEIMEQIGEMYRKLQLVPVLKLKHKTALRGIIDED